MADIVELKPRPVIEVEEVADYRCECGSPFWRLWADGSVWCAGCEEEVELTVSETP